MWKKGSTEVDGGRRSHNRAGPSSYPRRRPNARQPFDASSMFLSSCTADDDVAIGSELLSPQSAPIAELRRWRRHRASGTLEQKIGCCLNYFDDRVPRLTGFREVAAADLQRSVQQYACGVNRTH